LTEIEVQVWVTVLATVLSFVAGFLLSILSDRKKKKDARLDAARSLLIELNSNLQHLRGHIRTEAQVAAFREEIMASGTRNTQIFSLQIGAYQSLLYSGVFRNFSAVLQRNINNTYADIMTANRLEEQYLTPYTTPLTSETDIQHFREALWLFFVAMNTWETNLVGQITTVIAQLNGEFRTDQHLLAT